MSADIEAAGAVIYSPEKDAFLLLKHRQGHWAFAQGKLEGDEDIKAAAKREIEEETGITVEDFDDNCEVRVTYNYHHRGRRIEKAVTFYLVVSDGPITISSEHRGFLWVGFREAYKLLKFRNHTRALEEAAYRLTQRGVSVSGFSVKKYKAKKK